MTVFTSTPVKRSHIRLLFILVLNQLFANGTGRAIAGGMKYAWLGCLLLGGLLSAGTQDSEFNVNSRYTVETVMVSGDGWTADIAADHDRRQAQLGPP